MTTTPKTGSAPGPIDASDNGQSRRQSRWMATLLLFIMGVAWGLQFALLKLAADEGLNEPGILTIALLLLAPIYGVMLVARRELFWPSRRHLVFFLISGLLGYLIPLGTVVYVAPHLPAGLIALIASLTPVITVLAVTALGIERVSTFRVAAIIIGILAATIVLWSDLNLPGADVSFWILVAFLTPLAYGFDGLFIEVYWPEDLGSLQVVAGEALVSGLVLLPFYIASGATISFAGTWTTGHWGIILFVLVSVIEVFLFFHLIRTAGAVLVSFGSFISLVAGVFWGFVIFGERLDASIWIAVVLLSIALICVTLGAAREERRESK